MGVTVSSAKTQNIKLQSRLEKQQEKIEELDKENAEKMVQNAQLKTKLESEQQKNIEQKKENGRIVDGIKEELQKKEEKIQELEKEKNDMRKDVAKLEVLKDGASYTASVVKGAASAVASPFKWVHGKLTGN